MTATSATEISAADRRDSLSASPAACDDDGGSSTASELTLRAVAGRTYIIVVDGFRRDTAGSFVLGFSPL